MFYGLTNVIPLASNATVKPSISDCEAFKDAVPTTPHGTNMTWKCEVVDQGVQTLPPAVLQLSTKDGISYWWNACGCNYIKYKMLYLKNDPTEGWTAAKKMVNIGVHCTPNSEKVTWHECRTNFMFYRTEST